MNRIFFITYLLIYIYTTIIENTKFSVGLLSIETYKTIISSENRIQKIIDNLIYCKKWSIYLLSCTSYTNISYNNTNENARGLKDITEASMFSCDWNVGHRKNNICKRIVSVNVRNLLKYSRMFIVSI